MRREDSFFRNFARQSRHNFSSSNASGKCLSAEWIKGIEDLFKQPSTNEESPVNLTSQRGGRQSIVLNQTRPSGTSDRKRAAVLVPLCNRHGIASVIFTLRTDTVSTHKASITTCITMYASKRKYYTRVRFHFLEDTEIQKFRKMETLP